MKYAIVVKSPTAMIRLYEFQPFETYCEKRSPVLISYGKMWKDLDKDNRLEVYYKCKARHDRHLAKITKAFMVQVGISRRRKAVI